MPSPLLAANSDSKIEVTAFDLYPPSKRTPCARSALQSATGALAASLKRAFAHK